MKETPFRTNPTLLFKDGLGPGLEPVGGEFQPQFETAYPGGGTHIFTELHSIFVLKTVFGDFYGTSPPTRYPPFRTIKTDPLSMSVAPINRMPMFCSLKTTAPYKTPKRTLRRLRDIM